MQKMLTKVIKDESGATAAEYALLVAGLGSLSAAAAKSLGGSINTGFTAAGTCITTKVC